MPLSVLIVFIVHTLLLFLSIYLCRVPLSFSICVSHAPKSLSLTLSLYLKYKKANNASTNSTTTSISAANNSLSLSLCLSLETHSTRTEMRAYFVVALISVLAAVSVSVVYSLLLPLERSFPLTHRVELDQLRARDRARHARILQGSVGGVVDFSVQGSSDPYFVGYEWKQICHMCLSLFFLVFIDFL